MNSLPRPLSAVIAIVILIAGMLAVPPTHAAPPSPEATIIVPPPYIWWRPDLTIEVSEACSFCSRSVDVVNQGWASAAMFDVTITIRDSGIVNTSTVKVPGLAAGARQTVYTLPASSIAPDCVTVRADSGYVVKELNESNNAWQYNPFYLCPAP